MRDRYIFLHVDIEWGSVNMIYCDVESLTYN